MPNARKKKNAWMCIKTSKHTYIHITHIHTQNYIHKQTLANSHTRQDTTHTAHTHYLTENTDKLLVSSQTCKTTALCC